MKAFKISFLSLVLFLTSESAHSIDYTYHSTTLPEGSVAEKAFIESCGAEYRLYFQTMLPAHLKSLGIMDTKYFSDQNVTKSCRRRKCSFRCNVHLLSDSVEFDFTVVQTQIHKGVDAMLECKMDLENISTFETTYWTNIVRPASDRCFVEALTIKK